MTESLPDHGARLTIDLAALAANYRLLAARAAPAETAAVVKADAYGLGIEAVVPALARAGCVSFYVAHLSEAARVRAVAPAATIFVLNGLPPGSASRFAKLQARPVLGSAEEAAEWRAAGGGPCALHVDTGMNRLGLRPEEAAGLDLTGLGVTTILTHFVSSECPEAPINAAQRTTFRQIMTMWPDKLASMPNSSAFFHEERLFVGQFRAGYALYGGNPTPERDNPMHPVVSLRAPIVQVRPVPRGETVGYNQRWTARRDSIIATISVGYADGYPRNGANTDTRAGGAGRLGGVLCPFAGNVSMDLITLDITDAPARHQRRGEEISLIDEVLTVDVVGPAAGTIGYEILTGLGRRYNRTYRT